MDVEQTLRDFLSGLVEDNSPETWKDKDYLIDGIVNSKFREIAFVHTFKLEIKGALDYEILEDEVYDYSYEDFKNKKVKYITDEDYELEKLEEQEYEDRRIENVKLLPSAKIYHKDNLTRNLIKRKRLKNHSVFWNNVLYSTTFKLELYTSQDYSDLPIEELRSNYIYSHVREFIEKIEAEIRKFPEPRRHNIYFRIIEFYRDKLIIKSQEQNHKNISLCYKSILGLLNDLLERSKDYFKISDYQPSISKKLIWNETHQHFIEFFDRLINEKKIEFQGKSDRRAIYSKLLHYIIFPENQNHITIEEILGVGKSHNDIIDPDSISAKISFIPYGLKAFCFEFKNIIIPGKPEKSIVLVGENIPLTTIAKQLEKIFIVRTERRPHNPIKKKSFINQFPDCIQEVHSESKSL